MNDQRITANVMNTGNILTMLQRYRSDHSRYPSSLSELEPYNFEFDDPRKKAQNLEVNSWQQAYIYSSDGDSCTLISPGRHGYQAEQLIPWPEFDGPHHADTSLVFKDAKAVFLAVKNGRKA
jgi:hypothetical protein